jgi:replicative DNA helicase
VAPHNLEAEQALLGVLLYDNAAYERLTDSLQGRHFYEPFHAAPVPVDRDPRPQGPAGRADPAGRRVQARSGVRGTGRPALPGRPGRPRPAAANVGDYARAVFDLALRRDLIRIGGEIASTAHGGVGRTTSSAARDQIEAAEQQLYTLAESGVPRRASSVFGDALRGAVEMTAEAYSATAACPASPPT